MMSIPFNGTESRGNTVARRLFKTTGTPLTTSRTSDGSPVRLWSQRLTKRQKDWLFGETRRDAPFSLTMHRGVLEHAGGVFWICRHPYHWWARETTPGGGATMFIQRVN